MKTLLSSAIVAAFALTAAPAMSDQVFESMQCELAEGKSEDDVIAAAGKWLAAARQVAGGEEMKMSIHFPVAGGHADSDFVLVLRAPSFEAWGRFWDNYPDSPLAEMDDKAKEITDCGSGRLYGGVEIEPG